MTHAVAGILLVIADGHRYGFDVMDATGLASGTVYPALRRLERAGLVTGQWEQVDPSAEGRPRRRHYAITPEGRRLLPQARARMADLQRLLGSAGPSLGGASGGGGPGEP